MPFPFDESNAESLHSDTDKLFHFDSDINLCIGFSAVNKDLIHLVDGQLDN